jgi:hypothetical protein
MLFILIVLCLFIIITEIITLYKTNKKKEMKIYILASVILLAISILEYLQLLPRHLLKNLSSFFIRNK